MDNNLGQVVLVKDNIEIDFTRGKEFQGKLYFVADDDVSGDELWVSDGTTNGTQLLKDINPNNDFGDPNYPYYDSSGFFSTDSSPARFTEFQGKLYFTAGNGVNGKELWVSDGTTDGTQLLKDINPGANDSYPDSSQISYGSEFTKFQGKLYFTAGNGVNGRELWVSDGTTDGTQLLKDINPGSANSFDYSFEPVAEFQDKLYFVAEDEVNGKELWVTDGTTDGTQLLKDINPGNVSSVYNFTDFTEFQGKLYFTANDGVNDRELWVSDGTTAGTQLLKDINPGSANSSPGGFTEFQSKLYFSAKDEVNGRELWVSDGTTDGTQLLKDINPGVGDSYPSEFAEFQGKLYFYAKDEVNGRELWVTDGTMDGTQLLKDINPGVGDSYPYYLREFQGKLYFSAEDEVNGRELWVSDGTTDGTQLLKDINEFVNPDLPPGSSSSSSYPARFTEFQGKLYFTAEDEIIGRELWVTDGTTVGTQLVADINPEVGNPGSYPRSYPSSDPSGFIEINEELYFNADNGDVGSSRGLYKLTFKDVDNTDKDITGTNGADNLTGTEKSDRIEALDGEDTVAGGNGNDTILGGNGKDSLSGNNGNDEIQGEGGSDRLFGQSGNDLLFGGDGDDYLEGNSGKDTLNGDAGNDFLIAGAGKDLLQGGDGNDFLSGNGGNDTLIGGKDNDILVGGGGKDTFAVELDSGRVIISDFTNGQDKLGLSGNLAFDDLAIVQNTTTTIDDIQGDALVGLRGRNFNTSDTLIKDSQDNLIAVLLDVDATDITSEDFLSI